MTDEFKTIANSGEGYYTEKRSKFLAFAHHVETVDEVKTLLEGYRKKYYDARHVCYAYMLGPERQEFRANDDGEPSSTAGKPILGQINSNELTDILIVVVRYYGGVNLGTSGLIVAYREAAADAIAHCEVQTRQVEEIVFSHEYVRQMHGFYLLKDQKTMRFDVVISFDAKDRGAVFSAVIEDVQKSFPDYELQVAMDTEFTEE